MHRYSTLPAVLLLASFIGSLAAGCHSKTAENAEAEALMKRSSAQATKAPSSIPSQTEAIRNNPNLPPQAKAMMMNQAQRSSR